MAVGSGTSITSHTSISPRKHVTINLNNARSDHITYIDLLDFFKLLEKLLLTLSRELYGVLKGPLRCRCSLSIIVNCIVQGRFVCLVVVGTHRHQVTRGKADRPLLGRYTL